MMKYVDIGIFCKEILLRILTGNYAVFRKIIQSEITKRPTSVLDLGCGTGILSRLFRDGTYEGIDIDRYLIAYAEKTYPQKSFTVMNAADLRFPDHSFDTVIIAGVIHHLNDTVTRKALREIQRTLMSGGRVIAIEAIPPLSPFNVIGTFLRSHDEGKHIRTIKDYISLFTGNFSVIKAYEQKGGIFDYGVFVLRKREYLNNNIS